MTAETYLPCNVCNKRFWCPVFYIKDKPIYNDSISKNIKCLDCWFKQKEKAIQKK